MAIIQTFGRPKLAPFKPLDQVLGEGLKVLCNAAMADKHKLLADNKNKPKSCSICGRSWTYTKYQKYKTKNGVKQSKNILEMWYKCGKYAWMCKWCYDKKWKERRKMREVFQIG